MSDVWFPGTPHSPVWSVRDERHVYDMIMSPDVSLEAVLITTQRPVVSQEKEVTIGVSYMCKGRARVYTRIKTRKGLMDFEKMDVLDVILDAGPIHAQLLTP